MRRNDFEKMTIVEQLTVLREDACKYACKYLEYVEDNERDPIVLKVKLQKYCHKCPLNKIHFVS